VEEKGSRTTNSKRIQHTQAQNHSKRVATESSSKTRKQESKVLRSFPSCSHHLQSKFKVTVSSHSFYSSFSCKNFRNPKCRSRAHHCDFKKISFGIGKRRRKETFLCKKSSNLDNFRTRRNLHFSSEKMKFPASLQTFRPTLSSFRRVPF
jgi:hypothetical protein